MHAGKKKCEKIKSFWKNLNLIFEFLTQFFENLTKKRLSPKKKQTFEKVIFDAKKVLLGPKLLLGDIFLTKNQRKNHFFKILKIS